MPNTDIRIDLSFKGHRKRKKLRRILGDNSTEYLLDLWLTVAQDRPNGILTGWDERDISDAAGWPEKKPAHIFINALIECGFLEKNNETGEYFLHNWEKRQPWVSNSEARSESARIAAYAKWGKYYANIDTKQDADLCDPQKNAEHTAENSTCDSSAPYPILSLPNPNHNNKQPQKRKYGEFQNVLLTDDEYTKLQERFNSSLEYRINNLSEYIASKGTKYKSHYATILSWARKEEIPKTTEKTPWIMR